MAVRNNWTREELILAYNLYCKLPYGHFNVSSKEVQHLAKLIGRTPGAVAFKLVNFVNIDPRQREFGRKGACNGSKLDKIIFEEFSKNFDNAFYESEKLLAQKESSEKAVEIENLIKINKQGEDAIRKTKTRVNQDYFRAIVLSNYAGHCAVTDISIKETLVASHIKPWSKDEENRLNPKNGICLSATFDKLFDRGLMTIDNDFKIVYSNQLKSYSGQKFYSEHFAPFENKKINLPVKFLPDKDLLEYHQNHIFIG